MIHLRQIGVGILIWTLLPCAGALASPAQILLIRHGEKPDTGNQLSEVGFQRAQALVPYFETNPAVTESGIPVAIYAMKQNGPGGSVRAVQTVTPLANDLKLEIHQDYLKGEIQPLVKEILSNAAYNGKMVLICWEHKMIPDIAHEFGVDPRPDDWTSDDYWTVFEINFTDNKVASFRSFSEHLMPGDQ